MKRLWFSFPTDNDRWAVLIEHHMERCKSYAVSKTHIWFYEEEKP